MCGIVGYISTNQKAYEDEKRWFTHFALTLDTFRGTDSTGVMTVGQDFQPKVVKSLQPGDKFVHSNQWKAEAEYGWALVGHNRAATVGDVNIGNAHPFKSGPITLVHNGTLRDDGASLPTYDKTLDVDSMQIARALEVAEPNEVSHVLERINGAFALVWFDERTKTVNMCRNTERPLHFSYNSAKSMLWFMSEGLHLDVINRSMMSSQATGSTIYQLEPYTLLQWKYGKLEPEVSKFGPFVQRKFMTPTTTISGGTTKSSETALERATRTWQENLNASQRAAKVQEKGMTPSSCLKTMIAGQSRMIPQVQLDALEKEFGLNPQAMMKFSPQSGVDLDTKKQTGAMYITGEVIIEEWGDCPWEAVILNAKRIQYTAYKDQAWLVRPVGIGLPTENYYTPTILCHLVHCDWEGWAERHPKEAAPFDTEEDIPTVIGPQGRPVEWSSISAAVDAGCISCGMDLKVEDLPDTVFVNENRDILCKSCQHDLAIGLCKGEIL